MTRSPLCERDWAVIYNAGSVKIIRETIFQEKKPPLSPKKQRPQQSFKRRADLPKPESKVSTNEAKVAKGPIKTSGLPDTSSGPSRKLEMKKQEEEKKLLPLPVSVEPPLQGGHYELNARMTRMVETELRDIMIKVWHELPDNPSDEAEALVVDKLRNQAGDHLRNVLGLNITKRLLNVHNPLYVKVQFSGKPEKVYLGEFLKKYNFIAFKRIEKTVNMFAAQVKTINDFDRICSTKDIRCGDIKVSVTPIYKFTKCPPNLVTNFYDQEEDASDEIAETTEKEEKLEEKPDNIITPDKIIAKNEDVSTKPKVEDSKSESVTKVDKVVSKPVENKTVVNKAIINNPATENKSTLEKPVSKPGADKAVSKPAADKAVSKPAADKPVSKPVVENKAAVNKPTVENITATNKPAVQNKTNIKKTPVKPVFQKPTVNKPTPEKPVSKPAVQNKTVTKPAVDYKSALTKPVENKTVTKSAVASKPVALNNPAAEKKTNATKPSVENKEIKKPEVTPKINVTGKKPAPSPAKNPIKTDKTNKVDDYDELDDHDILALMSEGIVLDECSGSDDE